MNESGDVVDVGGGAMVSGASGGAVPDDAALGGVVPDDAASGGPLPDDAESGGAVPDNGASGGPLPDDAASGAAVVDAAAAALREHVDPGWVRVRTGAVDRLRAAVRPSPVLRGRHDRGDFFVAGQVLRAVIRDRVSDVEGVRPVRVWFDVDDDGAIVAATVELAVGYGRAMGKLADAARVAVRDCLRAVLGEAGGHGRVDVTVVDVDR